MIGELLIDWIQVEYGVNNAVQYIGLAEKLRVGATCNEIYAEIINV